MSLGPRLPRAASLVCRTASLLFWIGVTWLAPVSAYQTGVTGVSGQAGVTCADQCHSGGNPPRVDLVAPANARIGEEVVWRVLVWPASNRQVAAGLNLAAEDGQLVGRSAGLRVEEEEVTHRYPQHRTDINGDGVASVADLVRVAGAASAEMSAAACQLGDANGDGAVDEADTVELTRRLFVESPFEWWGTWRAPEAGTYRLWVAAVAANCNNARSGDGVASSLHVITVSP